jgi:predicted oxidoreductase
MQLNKIRPMSWNPLGFVFRKDIPQTHRLQQILATLVSKYHVGADFTLLGIKTSLVIPIAGTVNATRIQSLKSSGIRS